MFEEMKNDTILFHLNTNIFQTNISDLKNLIHYWHNAFDHFQVEIINLIQDDDIVSANLVYTGKQTTDFMGTASKGNDIKVDEMMFFRFENELLKEIWEIFDEKGMIAQMTKQ